MSELERATMADLQERELARLRSDLAGMAAQNAAMREAPDLDDIAALKLELGVHRAVSAAVCKLLDRDKWSAQDFADYVKGLGGPAEAKP
jgi:hypothetical protein